MKELALSRGLFVATARSEAQDSERRPGAIQARIMELLTNRKKEPRENKESSEVKGIREVDELDYPRILEWFTDTETQGHLDPLPTLPESWEDDDQVARAVFGLHEYYINNGEPSKITSLAAVNDKNKALGVVTIRWKGDPWMTRGHKKVASIERLVVDPEIRGKGIGTKLVEKSLEVIFKDKGFDEARAWVMSDEKAGNWQENVHFFRNLGFGVLGSENNTWREYAKKRNLGENAENRDAFWLQITKDSWKERQTIPVQDELIPPQPTGK